MSTEYKYSLSSDFSGQINLTQFQNTIEKDVSITTSLLKTELQGDDVSVWFVSALSGAEQTALNNIVSVYAYEPELNVETVELLEEEIKTGGHFQIKTVNFTAPATAVHSVDVSWPHPIGVLSVALYCKQANAGDKVTVVVAPDTIIGAIGANVAVSDTTFVVGSTVLQNLHVGYLVNLFDGVNSEDCGVMVSKDLSNSTITVSQGSTQAFSAASPTYVRMGVCMMDHHELPALDTVLKFGESKVGASHIPAGTTVRVLYDNQTAEQQDLVACVEYLY